MDARGRLRKRFKAGNAGQAIIEYVVILAVFAVFVLAEIPSFQDSVGTSYINSEDKVVESSDPTPPLPTAPNLPQSNEYTVTYNANGGVNAPAMQIKEHDVDLRLAAGVPTRSNYTFSGWSKTLSRADSNTIDFDPGDLYSENANLTLYASWVMEDLTYTLRFFVNSPAGATAHFQSAESPIIRTKHHNVATTLISDEPICQGYVFLGWSENSSSADAAYQSGSAFYDNRNADFYAIWTPVSYTVSYHANGGSGTVPASAKYTAGTQVTVESALLTKTGYQFAGWSADSGSSLVDNPAGSVFTMPEHDVDLYAVFMPTEFPYNGTDGTDGTIQSFTAPVTGTYQISLWGARGGTSCSNGIGNSSGMGGFTTVTVNLTRGQTVYFAVGGHGADNSFARSTSAAAANPGGWNGGGDGFTDAAVDEGGNFLSNQREGSGGGGGATAAYITQRGDGQLRYYASYRSDILGVAGGSSGANYTGDDGYGGGVSGGNGSYAGTQTSGYAFGRGESATSSRRLQ